MQVSASPPWSTIVTRSQNNIYKPKRIFYYLAVSTPLKSSTLTQAQKHAYWHNAMRDECDALVNNHTWDLVPTSNTQNIVGCKWIYRVKHKPNGTID